MPHVTPRDEEIATKTYKASWSAYIVFTAMWGIPIFGGLAAAVMRPRGWEVLLVSVIPWAFFCVWLAAMKLQISDSEVTYRSLFKGSQSLRWADVKAVSFEVGHQKYSDRFHLPLVRLVITPKSPIYPVLVINAKPFSFADLKDINQELRKRCPSAEFEGG
jgi:hypothetical protein